MGKVNTINVKMKGYEQCTKELNKVAIVCVISMNQRFQEGEYFQAFMCKIREKSEKKDNKLTIVPTDYLQRYYAPLWEHYIPLQLLQKCHTENLAYKIETDWLVSNCKSFFYDLQPGKLNVLRWKELIQQDDFKEAHTEVKRLYDEDEAFKKIINELAEKYGEKQSAAVIAQFEPACKQAAKSYLLAWCGEAAKKRLLKKAQQAAKNYLLEEVAVTLLCVPHYNIITYPGGPNKAIAYMLEGFTKKFPHLPLARWIAYNPKNDPVSDCIKTLVEKIEKKRLNKPVIIYVLSMDQLSQYGENFQTSMRKIYKISKEITDTELIVVITDAFVSGSPESLACEKQTEGFISNANSCFFDFFYLGKGKLKVMHWNELVQRADFKESHMKVERLYDEDEEFKQIVNQLADTNVKKYAKKISNTMTTQSAQACAEAARNRLLMEVSVWK